MANFKETFVKTIIWRIIGTLITILSGTIISGSWTFGLALGGLDTILKTFGYFFYELSWSRAYTYFRELKFKRKKDEVV